MTTASLVKAEILKSDHSTFFHSLSHGITVRRNSTDTKIGFYNQKEIIRIMAAINRGVSCSKTFTSFILFHLPR